MTKHFSLGVDLGKSHVKCALVMTRGDGGLDFVRPPVVDTPDLDTKEHFIAVIAAAVRACGAVPASTRIALTFPLPSAPDGRIQGRDKWRYFDRKTDSAIGADLKDALDFQSVSSPHDSAAQAEFVEACVRPTGLYGVMAFGTSIAFSLRVAGRGELTSGLNSTFSHIETGEDGPICSTCCRRCLGANYKARAGEPGAPVILRAVGIAARLPLSRLYLAGGALADQIGRAHV